MKKLVIDAVLEYDDSMIHGDDIEGKKWFYDEILFGEVLVLHSNEIGDSIGTIRILTVTENKD